MGGQLSTSTVGGTNEGLITFGSVMFENVTLEGNLAMNSVTFSDRVTNNTDIVVNTFFVEGYATITGDGSMDLNGGSINIPGTQYGGQFVGTPGFVNDVNHTIQGPGTINSSLSSNRLVFCQSRGYRNRRGNTANQSSITGSIAFLDGTNREFGNDSCKGGRKGRNTRLQLQ